MLYDPKKKMYAVCSMLKGAAYLQKVQLAFEQCTSLAAFATHQKNPRDTKEQF
jgi:hypothetical protein